MSDDELLAEMTRIVDLSYRAGRREAGRQQWWNGFLVCAIAAALGLAAGAWWVS